MEFVNSTRMVAGHTLGLEVSGRELLVVVVKGTFRIPSEPGGRLQLHEEQSPLVMSDVFFGEPGLSAPRYEADFAPRKRCCDVLLNGQAYAPGGQPTERVTVGMKIGAWSKSFDVVGDRVWSHARGLRASSPVPFVSLPVSYDQAFGGIAFMPNPCGRGSDGLDGLPLPNTEETGVPIERPDGVYRPMSFGSVGRHWDPRFRHAGTYDQHWLDHAAPLLPADFDERYYQAAPLDQQLPLPVGERPVTLFNLTPGGRCDFTLPHFEAPIYILPKHGEREDLKAAADTILIEPELQRVTMTWRVARPLRKNLFEIAQVLVGRKGPEWWQQRDRISFPIPIVALPMSEPS